MEVTRCAATWRPRIWGEAGTFLASDGADASTGQLIYVDFACQITGVWGNEARQLAHRSLRVQSGIGGAVRI